MAKEVGARLGKREILLREVQSGQVAVISNTRYQENQLRKREIMGACTCGYTRDEEKNCDGTHKVVKAVKADLAEKLEANGFPHAAEYVRGN